MAGTVGVVVGHDHLVDFGVGAGIAAHRGGPAGSRSDQAQFGWQSDSRACREHRDACSADLVFSRHRAGDDSASIDRHAGHGPDSQRCSELHRSAHEARVEHAPAHHDAIGGQAETDARHTGIRQGWHGVPGGTDVLQYIQVCQLPLRGGREPVPAGLVARKTRIVDRQHSVTSGCKLDRGAGPGRSRANDDDLCSSIEALRDGSIASWGASYMHLIRVFGNEAAHESAGRGRIPAEIGGKDLMSLLFCPNRATHSWVAYRRTQKPSADAT